VPLVLRLSLKGSRISAWGKRIFHVLHIYERHHTCLNVANVLHAQHDTLGAITAFKRILDMDSPTLHDHHMDYANYRVPAFGMFRRLTFAINHTRIATES